ncbi:MAG: HEPN domain-containing protein [Patescibacteria group bacterium]
MTEADVIAHWRKGARDALEMAQLALQAGKYDHALFNCQLAVEKALKAKIMEKTRKPHPKIHDLRKLSLLVHDSWTVEENELFDIVSSFAVAARYDDPLWAQQYATAEHATKWIERSITFCSHPSL